MFTWSLRPATEDDLPKMLAIEAVSYPLPWTEAGFRAEMAKPYARLWVLSDDETDEEIGGYLVFWVMGEAAEILNVTVQPQLRRQGLAERMIRRAVSEAMREGAKKAVLDVRKSNEAAIHLYQKLGFSVGQVRKRFYADGEDAYQMSISLEEDGIRFE